MKKILIVDDLKPFVEKEKSILSRSNVQIFTATSGQEALSIHRSNLVDLIIADLDMPGMAGDELCSIIRDDPNLRFVSFLMVTRPKESDIAKCIKSGANDYITKPIDPVALIEKATSLLGVPVRKAFRAFVNVTVKGGKEQTKFTAVSLNISTSGLLIETKKLLNIGDSLDCSFFLPGTSVISATGEIVRVIKKPTEDAYQYGIKFTAISDTAIQIIDDFIKKRRSQMVH